MTTVREASAQCERCSLALQRSALAPLASGESELLLVAVCATGAFFGWLAIRLSETYLPPPPLVAYDFLGGYTVDQSAATVECAPVDLPRLDEQVRRTAQAVLPSVVAVRPPSKKPEQPSEAGQYQSNYASGVIITADGIVLTQGHVSHWKFRDSSATGSVGDTWCRSDLKGPERFWICGYPWHRKRVIPITATG